MSEMISFNDWIKNINDDDAVITRTVNVNNGSSFPVDIKTRISVEQRSALVTAIVDMCFSDGEYYDTIRDFAYGFYMIAYFTNVDCSCGMEDVNKLIYETNIIPMIEDAIYGSCNSKSIRSIYDLVCNEIDARNNHVGNACKSITSTLGAIVDTINSIADSEDYMDILKGIVDGNNI